MVKMISVEEYSEDNRLTRMPYDCTCRRFRDERSCSEDANHMDLVNR